MSLTFSTTHTQRLFVVSLTRRLGLAVLRPGHRVHDDRGRARLPAQRLHQRDARRRRLDARRRRGAEHRLALPAGASRVGGRMRTGTAERLITELFTFL